MFGASSVKAANWYVSLSGTDTKAATGAFDKPFRTMQAASKKTLPGDTVFVRGGTYRNSDFGTHDIWSGNNADRIVANGTKDAYIVFMPFPGEKVYFEFDGLVGIFVQYSSYVKVVGFDIKGMADKITRAEAEAAWGLYIDDNGINHDLLTEFYDKTTNEVMGTYKTSWYGRTLVTPASNTVTLKKPYLYNSRGLACNLSHHIEFLNNTVHDTPSAGIRSDVCDYITIAGNTVYNCSYWTSQGVGAIAISTANNEIKPNTSGQPTPMTDEDKAFDGIKYRVTGNVVHDCENRMVSWDPGVRDVEFVIDEGSGIFLTRNRYTYQRGYMLVANNVSYRNGANGIVCHYTNRVVIENNSAYDNGTDNYGPSGGIAVNTSDTVTIRNNISYSKPNKMALGVVKYPSTYITIENNLIYNSNGSQPITSALTNVKIPGLNLIDGGYKIADPLFADKDNDDFHLTENSPAVNAGSTSTGQTFDKDGLGRDAMPDIGAYEFVAAPENPTSGINDIRNRPATKIDFANGILTIHQPAQLLGRIAVLNIFGQDFSHVLNTDTSATDKTTIDLSRLCTGFYLIHTDGGKYKIYKQ